MTKFATGLPDGSVRSSGSLVSRPTSITLFMPFHPPAQHLGHVGAAGRDGCRVRRMLRATAYRPVIRSLPAPKAEL
jgi:hypothetical protein